MNNIDVLLKNNIFIDNYDGARFYRILTDTGLFYSTYKKLLQGGII